MFNLWSKRDYFKSKPKLNANQELFNKLSTKGCVDCGCSDFLEGPSGGLATNVKCANDECGSEFNIMPMGQWAERIKHVSRT